MMDDFRSVTVRQKDEREKNGKLFAKQFSDFVNSFSNDDIQFVAVDQMTREHRTIQQNMMKFFMKFVDEMAKQADEGRYDLRNEASVKLAQHIRDNTPPEVKALPYI